MAKTVSRGGFFIDAECMATYYIIMISSRWVFRADF